MGTRTEDKVHDKITSASRREFLKRSAAVAGSVSVALAVQRSAHAAGSDMIRLGLVGCGGRGTGAARQALSADSGARLVAASDAFGDRLENCLRNLKKQDDVADRVTVDADHRFTGFDGYQGVIASDVDAVLLATPPQFRPMQFKACIEAGKHVFAEKPVAVDAPGVRSILETNELAKQKNLCVVSGLNGRYSPVLQDLVGRIHDGAIGDVLALHAARYGGGVWVRAREPGMTDMQYQMRNWYYFTWLSGDFNVEQFVHQLDRMAWVMKDEYPVRCYATGGRQARTGPDHGHIYDHFSTVFEYAGGARVFSTTRHQRGCSNESQAFAIGSRGTADLKEGLITGDQPWQAPRGTKRDTHQIEQDAFLEALRAGKVINNGEYMANSTMMAIMSRMSAYTGRSLTWEQAITSKEDLSPSAYAWDGQPPASEVAVPGLSKFI
jgi:myo-inositol 2-dehydrogenase / D-chiro-inositol 1-dehydrogenase